MNDRKAIVSNQKINLKDLSNNNCYIEFTIEKEIGRGASCIVYEASYEQNGFIRHCRLKEFFPIDTEDKKYDVIRNNNLLMVQEHSKELFDEAKNHFLEGIKKHISFYESISDARNQTSYIGGIYSAGDSVYCTMLCDEGTSYDKIHEERLIDILKTAKAIAVAVSKYHNYTVDGVKKAILHLDLKPSNVFVLSDTREIIKLFDYDSVIFKEDLHNANIRLSGSKGYMPHELESAKIDWISEKTDIYSIGAIVFERVMGRCVDNSTDKRAKNIDIPYNNPLFKNLSVAIYEKLNSFFKKTCCCGIVDRFNNTEELISALNELIEYAKPIEYSLKKFLPFVTSSFLGRENELNDIDQELQNSNYVILSGMGGIGKTELAITYANIAEQNKKYNCYFINYQENLQNTIMSMDFENIEQYYVKSNIDLNDNEKILDARIDLLSKLGNTTLLVIDNMDMNSENVSAAVNETAFIKLVSCGVKIIFTSRNSFAEHCLPIGTLHEEELLKMIDHDETNIETAKKLIETVDYHTLAVDLIGKTIRESWGEITPETMLESLKKNDIDTDGFDEVTSSKDRASGQGFEFNAKLYEHIKKLFSFAKLSTDEIECLQNTVLFGNIGIDAKKMIKFAGAKNKKVITDLARKGWLVLDTSTYNLQAHPIIQMLVCNELLNYRDNMFLNNIIKNLIPEKTYDLSVIEEYTSMSDIIIKNAFIKKHVNSYLSSLNKRTKYVNFTSRFPWEKAYEYVKEYSCVFFKDDTTFHKFIELIDDETNGSFNIERAEVIVSKFEDEFNEDDCEQAIQKAMLYRCVAFKLLLVLTSGRNHELDDMSDILLSKYDGKCHRGYYLTRNEKIQFSDAIVKYHQKALKILSRAHNGSNVESILQKRMIHDEQYVQSFVDVSANILKKFCLFEDAWLYVEIGDMYKSFGCSDEKEINELSIMASINMCRYKNVIRYYLYSKELFGKIMSNTHIRNHMIYQRVGDLYQRLGLPREAKTRFEISERILTETHGDLVPYKGLDKYYEYHYNLAKEICNCGKAIAYKQKWMNLCKKNRNFDSLIEIADLYEKDGNTEKAVIYYKKAINESDLSDFCNMSEEEICDLYPFTVASSGTSVVVELSSAQLNAYNKLGDLLMRLNQTTEAERTYRRVIDIINKKMSLPSILRSKAIIEIKPKSSNDFDMNEYHQKIAEEYERIRDFKKAVENFEQQIVCLMKIYNTAMSWHIENLKYPQTYNGKHFLETARKWKNDIIEVHKHISDIVNEHKELFDGYELINMTELFQD